MTKIAIRADGNSNIGLGHIQRCLSLSSQLQKEGTEVFFITKRNKAVKEKIGQEGFKVMELKNNLNLEEDLKHNIEIIKTNKVTTLITDSYELNEKYLLEVKENINLLVSIDDLAYKAFPSDIVFNGAIFAKNLPYRSLTGKTKFYLGPKYVILREEFAILAKRNINEKDEDILVTLGGSDFFNLTTKILRVLGKIKQNFKIHVVIGPFFSNIAEIEETAKAVNKEVELIYNFSQMANLMLSSDLAITGGGTTLYELAATGTPALAFCLVNNQVKNIKGMAKAGTIIDMGWGDELQMERFSVEINELMNNYQLRKEMSKLGQELVDGKGSQRVTEIILREFREKR